MTSQEPASDSALKKAAPHSEYIIKCGRYVRLRSIANCKASTLKLEQRMAKLKKNICLDGVKILVGRCKNFGWPR